MLRLVSDRKQAYPLNAWVRELAYKEAMEGSLGAYNLYKKTLLFDAVDNLDSYLYTSNLTVLQKEDFIFLEENS